MAIDIQTNFSSLQAQINVSKNTQALQSSFQKLSSGYRVNSAADDAAGLAISESMKAQIRSYTVAQRNAADGISMSQTAEGALGQIHDILGRMRELAMQSSNGTLTDADRAADVTTEFSSLQTEIGRIQDSTKFNGTSLIAQTSGGATSPASVSFQVGLGGNFGTTGSDTIGVNFNAIDLSALVGTYSNGAASGGAQVDTADNASATLATIDTAIATVSTARAGFGAAENRLTAASNNIQSMSSNLSAANGRIVDVDVASETANMSKNQVLAQAGISVLAQANQLPQLAFGLIGK
jgi:flagellin